MKNLIVFAMVAMVLTIINGCQKEELVNQIPDLKQSFEIVNQDVYLEKDYLSFRNFEVFDSISKLLNASSIKGISDFEQALGFKSSFTFRREAAQKLEENESNSVLINQLVTLDYYDQDCKCLKYPFYNESRAVVLNKEGKVRIGKILYEFKGKQQKMFITDNNEVAINSTKIINLDKEFHKLKSGTILWEYLASDGGEQRLKLHLVREYMEAYDYIIVNGQVVWGYVGSHWVIYVRCHSYRQRTFTSPDRETYFHWTVYKLNAGGNDGHFHWQYYPTVPITETSPWTSLYSIELYDSGLTSNTYAPKIWELDMHVWSDRVPNKTRIIYSD